VNLFEVEIPDGRLDVADAVGSKEYAMFVYHVQPGETSCPYHYEYEEEWLLVLDGSVALRTPEGENTAVRGDLVCFPPGAAGGHQVTNRADAPARIVMFSSARTPGVSVYPDSDKIGVWVNDDADSLVFKRSTAVPYSD
jgi:uncharacterized cupin superfamily protein